MITQVEYIRKDIHSDHHKWSTQSLC